MCHRLSSPSPLPLRNRLGWAQPLVIHHLQRRRIVQKRGCISEAKCSATNTTPEGEQDSEVEFRNVTLSYGKKKVIENLKLNINRGESVAIIGTSGTGKSTALRLISGLEMPTSGDIYLRGTKRTESIIQTINNKEAMSKTLRISMVFQNSALFDSLTVGENIAFKLCHGPRTTLTSDQISALTSEWIERVGLPPDVIDKLPEQLSGGMKKRASFARAVMFDPNDMSTAPDILLYDEPTAGLDPTASTRIENLIRQLQQFCPTCVVVTHQFSTIRRATDRVIFLHEGGAVWEGPVADMETTDNPYIRQFMTSSLEGPLISGEDEVDESDVVVLNDITDT